MEFDIATLWYLGGVPLVIALVQVAKMWFSDTRIYPIIAIILGIVLEIGIGAAIGAGIITSVIVGLIVGLAAAGLYSGVSTLNEGELADKAKRKG